MKTLIITASFFLCFLPSSQASCLRELSPYADHDQAIRICVRVNPVCFEDMRDFFGPFESAYKCTNVAAYCYYTMTQDWGPVKSANTCRNVQDRCFDQRERAYHSPIANAAKCKKDL